LLDVCLVSEKKAQLIFAMLAVQWRKTVRLSGKRAGQTDRKSVVGQTLKVYGLLNLIPSAASMQVCIEINVSCAMRKGLDHSKRTSCISQQTADDESLLKCNVQNCEALEAEQLIRPLHPTTVLLTPRRVVDWERK
jgi:hypothetical protein